MSFLCHHTSPIHRNIKIFFLQWMRNGDVESRRRKAPTVLLHCDVAWFHQRSLNLVLFLDHDSREAGCSGRVTENVSDVVVAKHQRRTIVATGCVISVQVHHRTTGIAFIAEGGTRKGSIEQGQTQAELECSAEDIGL